MCCLPDFKLTSDDLISTTIYTTVFEQFPVINRAWETVFTENHKLPTRTTVGVSALPLDAKIEMEFIFYK